MLHFVELGARSMKRNTISFASVCSTTGQLHSGMSFGFAHLATPNGNLDFVEPELSTKMSRKDLQPCNPAAVRPGIYSC